MKYPPFEALLAIMLTGTGAPAAAQSFYDYGIAEQPGGPIVTNKVISVRGDSVNATYSFYAVLPEGVEASTVSWSTSGGMEIVEQSATSATVCSRKGTTYNDSYSRYSDGYLVLTVDRTKGATGDCECAPLCDPKARFYLYFRKIYDIGGNPINGPDCANAGDTVTFSVEPWASLMRYHYFDGYEWTVEPSEYVEDGSQFFSADRSSTTFTIKKGISSIDGLKLSCRICAATGDMNTKTLSDKPGEPALYLVGEDKSETLVTDNLICVPANASSMTLRIANYAAGIDYKWDAGTWICTDMGDGLYSFKITKGEKRISLKLDAGCGNQSFAYNVSRSLVDGLYVTDLDDNRCFTSGSDVTLKIYGGGEGLDLRWDYATEVRNGWTLNAGDAVMPTAIVGNGPLTVKVHSAVCNASDVKTFTLNIPPNTPEFADDYSCLEIGSADSFAFSVKDDPGAESWEWTSSRWSFETQSDTGKDGLSVTATPSSSYMSTSYFTVNAKGYAGCGSKSAEQTVRLQYAKPALSYSGDCTAPGGAAVFSVTPPESYAPSYYVWDFGGMTDSDGKQSYVYTAKQSFELTAPAEEGTYTVTVRPSSICNTRNAEATTATKSVEFSHKFKLSTNLAYDDEYEDYAIEFKIKKGVLSATQITDIKWVVNGVPYPARSVLIPISQFADGDTVAVAAVVTYGSSGCSDAYDGYTIVRYPSSSDAKGNKSLSLGDSTGFFKLYPNPTDGILNVSIDDDESAFYVRIYDTSGNLLLSRKCIGPDDIVDVSSLPPSVYICAVEYNGDSQGKLFRIK